MGDSGLIISYQEIQAIWEMGDLKYELARATMYRWRYFRKEHRTMWPLLCMRDINILVDVRNGRWRIKN